MTFATFIRSAAIAFAVVLGAGTALAGSEVPAPGQSPKIDAIKQRGALKAAAIGEFPWLPENTTRQRRRNSPVRPGCWPRNMPSGWA